MTRPMPDVILGIETSCDDTSVGIVRAGRTELALVSQAQIAPHARHGGIVPEVASRIHAEVIDEVLAAALRQAGMAPDRLDAVAVTHGPGLAGSLLVGVAFAEGLALGLNRPLIPVNHLEGHFAAPWLDGDPAPRFPVLALIVSGGHTELVYAERAGAYRLLGRTRDDAAGEAFDKVARLLGLPFPGGPAIEQAAARAPSTPYTLPRARLPGTYDFSFSGLKTAVTRLVEGRLGPAETARIVRDPDARLMPGDPAFNAAVALAMEQAVVDILVAKTVAAARAFGAASIVVTGGVSANRRLRDRMRKAAPIPVHVPALRHCTDNGSMIALAGGWRLARGDAPTTTVDVEPGLQLAAA